MLADVPSDGAAARVEMSYRVGIQPGTRRVPLRGLTPFGTRFSGVTASVGSRTLPLFLEPGSAPLVTGYLELPEDLAADSLLSLTLRYSVEEAVQREGQRFKVALPLLFVDWKPTSAPPDAFTADTRFPRGHVITESFPTVPRLRYEEGGASRYRFELQVLPTFVSYRGQVGSAPLVAPELVVDLAIIAMILALGYVSWIGMKRDVVSRGR